MAEFENEQPMYENRPIPTDEQAERYLLGGILRDPNVMGSVVTVIASDEFFFFERHRYIWHALTQLYRLGTPIDVLTLSAELEQEGKIQKCGGREYIFDLMDSVASSANVEWNVQHLRSKFVLRQLIKASDNIIKKSLDASFSPDEVLETAEKDIFAIADQQVRQSLQPIEKFVTPLLDRIANRKDGITGIPTGITELDQLTNGLQDSDLIILAARPGMGKTSFVLSVARNAAVDFKKPVALFSLEMSSTQLAHRLFAMESGISSERISRGKLDDAEWVRLSERIQTLNSAPLYIDDTPELSVFDLRAKCRRLKNRYDIQLIIIDYLQLMKGGDDGKNNMKGNREQEISFISRSLKQLARELNVPVIALSQLSREVEKRTGSKRPQLSDLRESGAIEQDADMVFFIYRPEVYKQDTFEDDTPSAGLADIQLEKNRHGSTKQDLRVRFEKQYTKFCDMDEGYSLDTPTTEGISNNASFDTLESKMNDEDEELPY